MIGASYMIYLSYKIATSKPLDDGPSESQRLTPLTGAMLQFVNGKAWIHDIVLLGSFGTVFFWHFGKDDFNYFFYYSLFTFCCSMGWIRYILKKFFYFSRIVANVKQSNGFFIIYRGSVASCIKYSLSALIGLFKAQGSAAIFTSQRPIPSG